MRTFALITANELGIYYIEYMCLKVFIPYYTIKYLIMTKSLPHFTFQSMLYNTINKVFCYIYTLKTRYKQQNKQGMIV